MLKEQGYRVPQYSHYQLSELGKARSFMDSVEGRCVVKPRSGSGGRGITTGVADYFRLMQASIAATTMFYTQQPMIEEEIAGESFRLLFLDGSMIHAIKRCRPSVVGDGRSTIRRLIEKENWERLNSKPIRSLTAINVDLDCKYYLKDNGMSLDDVPPAGEIVAIKNVVNENSDRDNFPVRDEVHPYFHKLGSQMSSQLGIKLLGIDVIAADLSLSLDESGGVINELNIPPGLHYHELTGNSDEYTDVATRILENILSGSVLQTSVPAMTLDRVCP
jgi:cyanophycin synthetase